VGIVGSRSLESMDAEGRAGFCTVNSMAGGSSVVVSSVLLVFTLIGIIGCWSCIKKSSSLSSTLSAVGGINDCCLLVVMFWGLLVFAVIGIVVGSVSDIIKKSSLSSSATLAVDCVGVCCLW